MTRSSAPARRGRDLLAVHSRSVKVFTPKCRTSQFIALPGELLAEGTASVQHRQPRTPIGQGKSGGGRDQPFKAPRRVRRSFIRPSSLEFLRLWTTLQLDRLRFPGWAAAPSSCSFPRLRRGRPSRPISRAARQARRTRRGARRAASARMEDVHPARRWLRSGVRLRAVGLPGRRARGDRVGHPDVRGHLCLFYVRQAVSKAVVIAPEYRGSIELRTRAVRRDRLRGRRG